MPAQSMARDEAGNIWEVDSQGKPVRLAHPAQGGGPNVVMPSAPPEPKFVPDHPNLVYNPGNNTTSTVPGVPTPPPPAPTFVPGMPGIVAGPNGTAAPLTGVPGAGIQMDASQRAKAIQQYNYAKQLDDVAAHLSALYLSGPGATKGVSGFKDFLPFPANKNFDTEANKSRGIVGQTLGFTGGQLNTPQEAEKAVGPYIPESGDFDTTIEQKIRSMRDLAENGRQNAIQTLGGVPDENGNIVPDTPTVSAPLPPITPPGGGDQFNPATGKTRDQIDPMLRATGQRVGAMLASGVPDAQITDFLKQSGVDPANTSIQQALQFRKTDDFKRWQRANPGQSYPIGPQFYTKQVPMSAGRQMFNKASQNGAVGAGEAAIVAAGNSLTGNRGASLIGSLSGDPEMAKTGMELLRTKHGTASLVGDIAGQGLLEYGAGRIPGVQSLLASRWGRRGFDALAGDYYGSGDDSGGDSTLGGIGGAATNMLGGMFGRGLQRSASGALKGIRNADLGYLDKAGVPLTIGRIARGAGDFNPLNPSTAGDEVGKGVAGIEDRLAGLPGLDAVIGTARQRGDQAFNQATFREIAPNVTGTGAAGLTSAKAAKQAAYAKIAPVRLAVDQPFTDALDNAAAAAKGLNHHSGDVQTVIDDIRAQIASGEMTGKGYQTALQAIRRTRATLNDDVGGKAGAALDALEQNVADLGQRQGGQVAQDLAEANAIHARRQVVKAAVKGPVAQGSDEMFSPKALNQASILNTTRFGGLDRALSPDRPFYGLTRAGMKVMPNLTPDSGTAGRLLLYPLIAGAGGASIGAATDGDRGSGAERGASVGTGLGLLTLAAGAGPYSRTGQKLLQRALLGERPKLMQQIGDFLTNRAKLGGMFGAGIGRDYFYQPELPQ